MILVVGATGSLGGAVARRLVDDGREVRVLVRGSFGPEHVWPGVEAIAGDLKDPLSLRHACAGVSAVITTATSMGRSGDDTIESVDLHGNQHLIEAAAAEGVDHFVFTSSLGAEAESPSPFLRAKGQAERRLTTSGMTWTILQPNLFMDVWVPMVVGGPALASEPVKLVGEGRRHHSMVAMTDVVAYAVASLDLDAARNRRLVLGGPEPVSWRDVIAAFSKELDREITVRTVPLGEGVPGLPEQVNALFHALETYDSPIDMTALTAAYGIRPTPLSDFVRRFLAAVSERP